MAGKKRARVSGEMEEPGEDAAEERTESKAQEAAEEKSGGKGELPDAPTAYKKGMSTAQILRQHKGAKR